MDWEQHRYGEGVEVEFVPRATYLGRAALPELLAQTGQRIRVRALWLMGDADPYPGEWALGHEYRHSDLLGRTWIASGDVRELPNVAGDRLAPSHT